MKKPCIVMQTDFSLNWGAVAAMRGVSKQVDAELELHDITHEIQPFNTFAASSSLMYVEPFWPTGTVFVSVVDPGVGTQRKACVAKLKDGNYVVTPDNGALTHLYYNVGIAEVREIDETINRYKGTEKVSVFHGRDLFAYCAARLASGVITYEQVGPSYPVEDVVLHPDSVLYPEVAANKVTGIIASALPHFGNVITNIAIEDFEKAGFIHGDKIQVMITNGDKEVFNQSVLYHKSFGFVQKDEAIIFNGSTMYISLGLNQNNFMKVHQVNSGVEWKVIFKK